MTSQQSQALGRALRDLRARAGLTQAHVAAEAGFDGAYLSRVEGGIRDVQWSTVLRFLDAIGADLHQLADAITEVEKQEPPDITPPSET
jgi:transcriptional regulator with XRE-family HTH domain